MIDPGPTKRRVRFICRSARDRIDPKMVAEAFGATEVPKDEAARLRARAYPWFPNDIDLAPDDKQEICGALFPHIEIWPIGAEH